MSKLTQKIATVSIAIATVAALSGPVFAQSTTELQAQIAALLAQINALQAKLGTASTVTSSYNFAKNLTLGSKGADVTALQNVLISGGFLKIAAPTAFFGPLTKTAVAAWQSANGISPAAGYVGAISRAKLNSAVVVAPSTTPVVVGVPMSVSLAPGNPGASSLASGAVNATVLKLNFTSGATPTTVTGLTLTRSGLSQDSDLDNVYLYDGGVRLATNLGFNNGKINFSNAAGLFTVPANSTKTISVSVDVTSAATAGRMIVLGLASVNDITGGVFSGAFPLNGNNFTTASVTNLAKLNLSGFSSSTVTVNAGQTNYLVGQFTIQASNNPAKVTSLRLTNVGSVSPNYLQNVRVMQGTTQLGATVSALDNSNVLFVDLSSAPLMLTSGQSVVISLYADIMGGVNRTFQFSIQQSSDVTGVDTMYGVGIGADANSATTALDGFPVQFYSATINQGGVVASKNAATPTTNAVAGNTNQVFAKFDILASGDSIRFNQMDFTITGGNTITNFRVVDDQGVQIGTTGASVTTAYSAGSGSLNYIIPANVTRTITVYGDLGSTASSTVQVTLAGTTSAQSYTTLSSTAVSAVGANVLTVLASNTNLTAALNYSLGSPVNASAGNSNQLVASFALTAGQVNAINLTGVTLTTTASTTVVGQIRNLRVKIGNVQIGSVQPTVAASTASTFNSSAPIAIAANATVNVDVYADLASSVAVGTSTVVTLTSVNASTAAGNSVTASASPVGQVVSFNNGGTLTGTVSSATSAASYLGMGQNGVTVAKYQFTASNAGSATLTQLVVKDSASSATSTTAATDVSTFINYRLVDDSQVQLGTASESAGGIITFNLTGVTVAASAYKSVNLVADVNTYPYASSSGVHAYALTSMTYTNSAGATTTTPFVIGNAFTVYRTSLNVSNGAAFTAPTSISGVGTQVAQFSFGAGAGYDATIKTVVLNNSGALIQASTTVVLGLYDSAAPAVVLATSTATSTNNMTFTLNGGSGWVIPATNVKTLVVKEYSAPANLVAVTSGTGSYQVSLQSVTWSDSVTATISSLSPSIALPIGGQNLTNLSN